MLDKLATIITSSLVIAYFVLASLYALDRQGTKSLYWLGAALLTFAVLKMK